MTGNGKRLLALLLALALCVSLLPATALAEEDVGTIAPADEPGEELQEGVIALAPEEPEALPPAEGTESVIASGTCEDGLTWTLYDSGELVISGTGAMKDYKEYDPDHESTYDQVAPWIHYIDRVTSLTVESGITKIGSHAFNGTAINVPSESTLESVSLPETLTSIGSYAFMGSKFTEFVFPSGIQQINYRAFSGCHELTEVFFRGSAPSFGTEAFRGVTATAYYPENDATWIEDVRQNYGGTLTWVAYEGDPTVIASGECGAQGDNLTWMLYYDGELVISGTGAMMDCARSLDVPWYDHIADISAVTIESGVTNIGNSAFYDCDSLKSITIPEGIISIGEKALSYCRSLTSVTLPESLTTIGNNAFATCSNLTSVTIQEGITSIGNYAFQSCGSLTNVTIPEGVTSIGERAFQFCSSLTSITLPESVPSIGDGVFYCCCSLTSITIPESVTDIGAYAFGGCSGLKNVVFLGSAPSFGENAFQGVTATAYYPAGDESWTEDVRQNYGGTITWEPYEKESETIATGECGDDLTWTLTDNGVLTITGTGDMWNWTYQEPGPWYDSRASITSVELPDGLTSIGDYAFRDCSSLTSVTIPAGVTSIGNWAFYDCSNLANIEIPGSVTGIGEYAFYGAGLTELTIPGSVKTIGQWAFAQNRSLECVTLQEGISSIGIWAFCYCSHLREIRIPASTAALGGNALRSDPALTDVYYGGTRSQWAQIAPDYLDRYQVTVHCSDGDVETLDRAFCGDDLTWTLENGVLTVSGTGDMWDFYEKVWGLGMSIGGESTAPWSTCLNEITGVVIEPGVTSVGAFAFSGCRNLSSISMTDGLTRIGNGAFQGCTSLQSVTIPQGVEVLGPAAFYYCQKLSQVTLPSGLREIGGEVNGGAFQWCTSLREITIPDSVTMIGNRAFRGCSSLETILLPAALTSIGWEAFFDCSSLTSVTLPASVTGIGDEAFYGCSSLAEVHYGGYEEAVAHYRDNGWSTYRNDPLFNAAWTYAKTLEEGWDLCGNDLLWQYDSGTRTLSIKGTGPMWDFGSNERPWEEYTGKLVGVNFEPGITTIGKYAFRNCDRLRSVELPEGVTGIGMGAFTNCSSLTNVELPTSLTSIGKEAFHGCSSLTSMELPAGLATIEDSVFYECSSLESVTIPESVTSIGYWAFGNCSSLESVTFQDGLTSIWANAFNNCSGLTSVTLPNGLTSIGNYAFESCSGLTSVTLPEGLTYIGSGAFSGCSSLTSVEFPTGLTSIGDYAFASCSSLTNVEFPTDLTSIGSGAFAASSMTRVTIPGSVTSIGDYAFASCSSLKIVLFLGGAPNIGDSSFRNITADAYYPDDGSWWEDDLQDYGGTLTWVAVTASGQCGDDLTWFLGGDGSLLVTGTGDMWDWEWGSAPWTDYSSSITSVELPYGLIGIGKNAFSNFSSLTSVIIPEGVTGIRANAFCYCSGLTSVEIPASVTGIGDYSFSGCTALTNVELPASVTSIGEGAFQECSSLTSMTIPEGVTSIGDWAFYYCSSLTSVEIPAKVISIGIWAFSYCSSLTSVLFLGSAPKIGENAFKGVTANAYYPVEDGTWTQDKRQNYGGKLTWIPYTGEPVINPFTDVEEGKYYYLPVLWAISQDPPITSGTGEGTFSPNQTCTRAQIVTFIWNAFGQPEPTLTNNPFEDVPEGKWYTKAVLWAVEKGITSGVDATHFGPNKNCTRAQVVTFLWNAYGKPEPTNTVNPFKDVKEGKYYYKAVLWAVEMGITSGMSADTFGTDRTCTRGQVVTFLYNTKDIPKP